MTLSGNVVSELAAVYESIGAGNINTDGLANYEVTAVKWIGSEFASDIRSLQDNIGLMLDQKPVNLPAFSGDPADVENASTIFDSVKDVTFRNHDDLVQRCRVEING